jgi:hypothetical protein
MGDGRKGGKEEESGGCGAIESNEGLPRTQPSSATNTGRPSSRNLNCASLASTRLSHSPSHDALLRPK